MMNARRMTIGIALFNLLLRNVVVAAPTTAPVDDIIHVRGVVLSPDGNPASGARVTIAAPKRWDKPLYRNVIARATTDADGKYVIDFKKSEAGPFSVGGGESAGDDWKHAQVIATSSTGGIAFKPWTDVDAAGELELRLPRDDLPIRGRIVDEAHQPIAGVRVAVELIIGDEAAAANASREGDEGAWARTILSVPFMAAGRDVDFRTDADGRFVISGIGRDRRVYLHLIGPTIGYARIEAATIERNANTRVVPEPAGFDSKYQRYGATFEHVAWGAQSVEGTIRDAATHEPLAGMLVQSQNFPISPSFGLSPDAMICTVTDEKGHYRLEGFPTGEGNRIVVLPADGQPYFTREAELPAGTDATIDLELHRGVIITGKVTDQSTGKPLPARMIYTTYVNNDHAQVLPEFHGNPDYMIEGPQGRYETQPDGTYRVVAVPGKAIVAAWCMLPGYRKGVGFDDIEVLRDAKNHQWELYQQAPYRDGTTIVREIDVPADAKEVRCDLPIDPGERVHVTIVDADGKPIARKVMARGQEAEDYGGPYFKAVDGGSFDACGFSSDEQRTIFVIDEKNKLGCAVLVAAGAGELEVKLRPLAQVSGRLLTAAGKPLASTQLFVDEDVHNGKTAGEVTTDAEGRFTISVPAGVRYRVSVWSGTYVGATVADGLDLQPGPNADLGDIRISPL